MYYYFRTDGSCKAQSELRLPYQDCTEIQDPVNYDISTIELKDGKIVKREIKEDVPLTPLEPSEPQEVDAPQLTDIQEQIMASIAELSETVATLAEGSES